MGVRHADPARQIHPSCVLSVLDVAERAGLSAQHLLAPHDLDRPALLQGTWVSWDQYRAVVESSARMLGGDSALCGFGRELMESAHTDLSPYFFLPVLTALRLIHRTMGPRMVQVFEFPSGILDGVLTLEMRLRDGHAPSATVFRYLASAAEELGTCLPVRVVDVSTHDRGFSYSLVRRDGHAPSAKQPEALVSWLSTVVHGVSVSRQTARSNALASVTPLLTEDLQPPALCRALAVALQQTLEVDGVEIALRAPDELVTMVGSREGVALTRQFPDPPQPGDLAPSAQGQLTIFGTGRQSPAILAALDTVTPWIATTLEARVRETRVARHATSIEQRVSAVAAGCKATQRQRDVLQLLVRGLTNAEIAEVLTSSEAAVENHVSALLRRTRAENRLGLVALCVAAPAPSAEG